jgi:hypothetical protein
MSASQPAIPRPACAREPAPLRSGSARPCMRRTQSRPRLPVATDATSADFPRAVCRRKALERSRGVVTPPHSAGMYNLFGFFLFGILFASRCSRLRSPIAMLSAVHRGRPYLALVIFCVRVLVGVGVIGIRAALPSGTHAAGCDLAGHQVIVSSLAGFCFALACVGHVLSWCALLMCRSCVCLRPVCASQSTFVLTYPKLHMYALL